MKKHISAIRRTRADRAFDLMDYIFLTIAFLLVAYPLYFVVIASVSDPIAVYEGRVILCQVYHVVCRDSRQWSLVEKDYSKVSILGSRRNMRWFHVCIWYGCNENLDDVKYYNGWVRYHDLRPMVRIEEVRSQLKKAA